MDHVYQWRLLLEEYGPKIVYIKGIHNTVADAISRLEYDPSVNRTAENYHLTKVRSFKSHQRQNWMTVSNHWYNLEIDTHKPENLNFVFANHGEGEEIYPLTTIEIAEAQRKDQGLKVNYKRMLECQKRICVFSYLRIQKYSVKVANLSFPHLYNTELLLGTTTTSSTLVTHISKRQ